MPPTPQQDWRHLGKVIRQWRVEQGIRRQADLAAAVGVSLKTIQNYEQGREPHSAPAIPDGYRLVGRHLGWTPDSIERILAGGQPKPQQGDTPRPATQVSHLAAPAFELIDVARDAGAPADLVLQARTAVAELLGWLLASSRHPDAPNPGYGLVANRPHAEGEGPAEDDAARILRAIEEHRPQ